MEVTGFGLANYRSFGPEGAFVHDFGKINVFIGKNNCGKSNILRFLQSISETSTGSKEPIKPLDRHRNNGNSRVPLLGVAVTLGANDIPERVLRECYGTSTPTLEVWMEYPRGIPMSTNPLQQLKDPYLERFHDALTTTRWMNGDRDHFLMETWKTIAVQAKEGFEKKVGGVIYVPAIREIRTETAEKVGILDLSGRNLVARLRKMQHPLVVNESHKQLFSRIGTFIQDLLHVGEVAVEIPSEEDDIYLTIYGNRLPLASYGTGVHELVIMCTTLALYDQRYICIEEPEIHLHPELLRRFMRFLAQTTNVYFIATHSNVLLDSDETTAVYHVGHTGTCSTIRRSRTSKHTREILHDLCYHASDLLQTNGIIWVEGPSDRIYINRWLELYGSTYVEGVNYSIMFYGGACLANLSAADCQPGYELVELLRINSNAIVVIDRDGDSPKTALKAYKKRLQAEFGEDKCWITKGREIENYLPEKLLDRWLASRKPAKSIVFGRNDKVEDCIRCAIGKKAFNYAWKKKEYAREIAAVMSPEDLEQLDLRRWVKRLHDAICGWNAG